MSHLLTLPTDLVEIVAKHCSEQARCAIACTCLQMREILAAILVTHAVLRSSVFFRRPFTAQVHYSADVARLFALVESRRFVRLKRLHVVVDSPAFLPCGAGKKQPMALCSRSLRSLRLSLPLCQRFPSVQPTSTAIARLIGAWVNLHSLTIEGVPNLCCEHLKAMRHTNLHALVLRECQCTIAFRNAFAKEALDGRMFPATLHTLELGLLDSAAILEHAMRSPVPHGLLSALPHLAHLTFHVTAEDVLVHNLEYFATTLQLLHGLQTLYCHGYDAFCACVAISTVCQLSTRFSWRDASFQR
jgi:hypothetical protein